VSCRPLPPPARKQALPCGQPMTLGQVFATIAALNAPRVGDCGIPPQDRSLPSRSSGTRILCRSIPRSRGNYGALNQGISPVAAMIGGPPRAPAGAATGVAHAHLADNTR